jgi:hypothetical protein
MRIGEALLLQGRTLEGGWTKAQFKILGVPWPPRKGWKKSVIGKAITEDEVKRFIEAREETR